MGSTFKTWELVVVWAAGGKDIYEYHTEEEAIAAGRNMRMALGNQIQWYGVREGGYRKEGK